MLIIGAGGLASQLFDDLIVMKKEDFAFWSETGTKYKCIKENFKIIQTDQEVVDHFNCTSRSFVVGIWDIEDRRRLTEKFRDMGGELGSFITPSSSLSSYTSIGNGCIVLFEAGSEPEVSIADGCIINKRVSFGHGCTIAPFCSIGPCAIIASDVEMGENCYVGMGAIIQPKVKIGKNVIISAGSVVTRNIADNAVVSGVPAKIRFFRKV